MRIKKSHIKLSDEVLRRADVITELAARGLIKFNSDYVDREEVLRVCVIKGLSELEKEI